MKEKIKINAKIFLDLDRICKQKGIYALQNTFDNDDNLVSFLHEVKDNIKVKKCNQYEKVDYSLNDQIKIVIAFYKELDAELGAKVEKILTKQDTNFDYYFIDSPNCADSKRAKANKKEFYSSCVGGDLGKKPDFCVYVGDDAGSLRCLAHECAHALSERIQQKKPNAHDEIGEIESHIVEYLFNEYLRTHSYSKKDTKVVELTDNSSPIVSDEEYVNFFDYQQISLHNNLSLILEERALLKQMHGKVNEQDLKRLICEAKTRDGAKHLIRRAKIMVDEEAKNKNSCHMLRYVLGEIISEMFYDEYMLSDEKGRKALIEQLKDFLNTNAEKDMTADTAVFKLLGLSQTKFFDEYMDFLREQNLDFVN